jgi:hypothetical protein
MTGLLFQADTDHEATSFGLIRSADSHRTRRRDRHRPAPRRAAGQPARTTRIPTPRRDRAVSRRATHQPIRLGASGSSTGPRPRCRPRTTELLSGGNVLSLRSLVDGPPYRGTEVKIRLVRSADFYHAAAYELELVIVPERMAGFGLVAFHLEGHAGQCGMGRGSKWPTWPAIAASKSLTHTPLLFLSQSRSIVGAAGSEAARTALVVGDFLAVYQRVAVFDLLGMVAAAVRARWLSPKDQLHVPDGTATGAPPGRVREGVS